jgi:hypothetical protein
MSTKILSVETVELSLTRSIPPQVIISCNGSVSTPGWEKPELILHPSAPRDGIYHFDFCAHPPSGNVQQLITPISASYTMKDKPADFKGVRINASSNFTVRLLEQGDSETENASSLENILGVEILNQKLFIRVSTGGCTTKSSFEVRINRGITNVPPYFLEIYRIIPDPCNGHFPDGVVLEYDFRKDLKIEPTTPLVLKNVLGISVR